jgi:hypothetical protein
VKRSTDRCVSFLSRHSARDQCNSFRETLLELVTATNERSITATTEVRLETLLLYRLLHKFKKEKKAKIYFLISFAGILPF